ncbi:MAG TPA: MerR family transcriptional regulator [Geminicoccaceae bacterium]|jgi:DNA-binding transcriptional MerR regulator|nr:MerR family transcriptional regulator [Geminicoccaceae bacterium]
MEGSTDGRIEDAGRQRAAGRAGKSAAAFRTISEVAGELDVAQHVLRFWESKFPQVRPLKRGGGRRYYRPEDVDLLRQIRSLLYEEGYTIKGAQKLLRSQRRGPAIDGEPTVAAAATPAEAVPLPELVPEVRRWLLELREDLVALRDALREVAG